MGFWAIVDKEWAEIRQNRLVLGTLVLFPALLLLAGLSLLCLIRQAGSTLADAGDISSSLHGFSPVESLALMTVQQFLFLFMLLPVSLPLSIASYSIVGEKQSRSLEPLLATPVGVMELLLGKSLIAAALPVVLTWLTFAAFILGTRLLVSERTFAAVLTPSVLLAIGILTPLAGLLSVLAGIIASSQVSDPRTAQQISGLLIIPLMGIMLAQAAGKLVINPKSLLFGGALLAGLNLGLLALAVRLFQRETILTQWRN